MMDLQKNKFDNECDRIFLKSLLSFLEEPDSDCISSGYSSGSSESLDKHLSDSNFLSTSGYFSSFSCGTSELACRKPKIDKTLHISWTESATGLRVSSYERKSLPPPELPAHFTPLPVFPRNVPTPTVPTSFSPKEEKQAYFRKNLKHVLSPDLNNHPQKLRMQRDTSYGNLPTVRETQNTFLSQMKMFAKTVSPPKNPTANKNKMICRFCLKNGEPDFVYTSHFLKYPNGIINCPVLKRYICDLCGATGDYAHTRKYCPRYGEVMAELEYKLSLWALATNHKL